MFVAYRGYSVILFAPVAALGAVLLTDPGAGRADVHRPVHGQDGRVPQALFPGLSARRGVRQGDRDVGLLASPSSPRSSGLVGSERAICPIVVVCALLTYGGVSLFVVVFAVYPFAAEMFRQGDIPKRLIPGTIALGRLHLHHGFAARHAADPEHHPDHVLQDQHLRRAVAGHDRRRRSSSSAACAYLEWRRRQAAAAGEGYGTDLVNEPRAVRSKASWPIPVIAILPLVAGRRLEQGVHRRDPAVLRRVAFASSLPCSAKRRR